MAFNWESFLELAKLLSEAPDEASQRTAISRAYYAAYHVARERLKNNGVEPGKNDNVHEFVWQHYNHDYDINGTSIQSLGTRLKWRRAEADYRDGRIDFRHAEAAITLSEALIAAIKLLAPTN